MQDSNGFFFSAYKDIMLEVSKREKEAGIIPHPDIDTYMKVLEAFLFMSSLICILHFMLYMKVMLSLLIMTLLKPDKQAISVQGLKRTLQTDYILKVINSLEILISIDWFL